MNASMAPLWMKCFPPSEFVDSAGVDNMADETISTAPDELPCMRYDIVQKLVDIECFFKKEVHFTDVHFF